MFPNRTNEDLGAALKSWRERVLGLRANQLAEKTGLSPTYLSDIEKGRRRLNEQTIHKITEGCGLTLQEFQDELSREFFTGRLEDAPAEHSSAELFTAQHHGSGDRIPGTLELARWFVNQLSTEEAVNLATRFMSDFKGGDADALVRANAILWILSLKTAPTGER